MCRQSPHTIALIVMGAFAIVTALGVTVTIIDAVIAIWTRWNAKQTQTFQEQLKENKYEIGRCELCLCYALEESDP